MAGAQSKPYTIFGNPDAIKAQIEAARERLEGKEDAFNAEQEELSRILKALKHDPARMSVNNLGLDGVLRTITADGQILDAIALPRHLCKAMLDRFPYDPQIENDFRGVDGLKVPRQAWFHPDSRVLPRPMTEAQKVQSRRKLEENLKIMQKPTVKVEELLDEGRPRGPRILSDYDLEPR